MRLVLIQPRIVSAMRIVSFTGFMEDSEISIGELTSKPPAQGAFVRITHHKGPVRALLGLSGFELASISLLESPELNIRLRLIIRGIVAEYGCTIKWTIILREVKLFETRARQAIYGNNASLEI
jgi:hypothetical protein